MNNWNHRDFLHQTTRSIKTAHELIFIPVINHLADQFKPFAWQLEQVPTEMYELAGRQPQSVARAWNDGIAAALGAGCDYIVILNEDIVLKHNAIDRLVDFANTHQEAVLWSMGQYNDLFSLEEALEDENFSEHPNFSAFMVHKSFPEVFGRFDENFVPAYCEDCDCHARIALANQKAYVYGGARFFHFGSQTLASDESLREDMAKLGGANGRYFVEKWGHGIVNEVDDMRRLYFPTPYNEADKPLNFWREVNDDE